jgi:hypothetical protein
MKRIKTGCVRYRRGRWEADFRDANGKRHMEAMSDLKENKARVKVEAQRRLHVRLVEVNAGSYLSPADQLTFEDAVHLGAVRHFVDQHHARRGQPPPIPVTLPNDPRVRALTVRAHRLADYERLSRETTDERCDDTSDVE